MEVLTDDVVGLAKEYSENGAQCVHYTHDGNVDISIVRNGCTYTSQQSSATGTLHLLYV